ncbi:hypothetical protein O6H91_14G016200 [Diphasiastrum complanatum]|uniref:Uncharacterized protein n=2 Tax=Diphasiastrum complanatum TaxID=34168 RepID=A0ACC2BMJ4_DIPCM|nr:hypothetical protein O6H91_14G016200 [Diphasiastrum complanatum]KAJ7530724.1 hypothetical protein O6H91_14G016200 [Diphasiastrum complanatum]
MERLHRRDESIATLYMKTSILDKPRVTSILDGRCRMHGPTDELDDSSFSKEALEGIISNDTTREEEHDVKDQSNKNGDANQDTLALTNEAFMTTSEKQKIDEQANALVASGLKEDDEVLSTRGMSENDVCLEIDGAEKTDEKSKSSSRRGRSKRKFLRNSLAKNLGSVGIDKQCAVLDVVQLAKDEASTTNVVIRSTSNEVQGLHVESPGSFAAGFVNGDLNASSYPEKKSPHVSQKDLKVENVNLSSLPKSKNNSGSSDVATISHSTETCTELQNIDCPRTVAKENRWTRSKNVVVPSQTVPEACDSVSRDVCLENRPVEKQEADEDFRRGGNIVAVEDNNHIHLISSYRPSPENCTNWPGAAIGVVLGNAGKELFLDHVQDSASVFCQDTGDTGKGKATAFIQCAATTISESSEGNVQANLSHTETKGSYLEPGQASNVEDCKAKADALYDQTSTEANISKVILEEKKNVLQIDLIQSSPQELKDVPPETAVSDDSNEALLKKESCSIKSTETEITLPVDMHLFHPLEDRVASVEGAPRSPHLEVYLESSKLTQNDDSSFLLVTSDIKSTKVSGVPLTVPSTVKSDTCASQHEEECAEKVEEGASKATVKLMEGALTSAIFPEQESMTSEGCEELSPTIPLTEEDVKVCDICGDAGYENFLAICSACSEGAEHIYCMRTRLMEKPKGNWFCENCKGKQESGGLSTKLWAQDRIIKEACEISNQNHMLKRKHSLLSAEHRKDASGDRVKGISSSLSKGDNSAGPAVDAVGVASLNKHVTENADCLQLASRRAQAQESMLKGKESDKTKYTLHTASESMSRPLPTSIDVYALKRQDSRNNSSKVKSSAMGVSPVSNRTELGKRKSSAPVSDMVVPALKRQALKSGDSMQARVSTMARPEKPIKHSLKGLENSKAKSMPLAAQGKGPNGGTISSSVLSKGKLENNAMLLVPADPKSFSAQIVRTKKDGTLTSLPAKPGNVAQEKTRVAAEVPDTDGLLLQSKLETDDAIDSANIKQNFKITADGGFSKCQPDVKALSQSLTFPRTKPVLATAYSRETVAVGDIQTEIGETRTVSRDLPHSTSSPHVNSMLSMRAADARDNPIASRVVSISVPPGATRCYRCKETGHAAKDCSRSLSNQVPDLRPGVSWATPTFVNGAARTPQENKEGNLQIGSLIRQSNCEEPFLTNLARPQNVILWRGGFEVVEEGRSIIYDGIQAHPSTKAVKEVYDAAMLLPSRLRLEEVQAHFLPNPPDGGLIALYFKAISADSAETCMKLLDHMTKHNLVLRGLTTTAELLVFTSNILPRIEQCWNGEKFLWGLFRKRKLSTPKSGVISNTWSRQNSITPTSYFTRENSEIYPSNFTPTVLSQRNFASQVMDVNTLAVENLDAADQGVDKFRVDHTQSALPSSSMTVFPDVQELQHQFAPSKLTLQARDSLLGQGLYEVETSKIFLKEAPVLSNILANDSLNVICKSPVDFRKEMGNIGSLPGYRTSAGISRDISNSTWQRCCSKAFISAAEKDPEQELQVSSLAFRPQMLYSAGPSTNKSEGQLGVPFVETNFRIEDKEVFPDLYAGKRQSKALTILESLKQASKSSSRTTDEQDVGALHRSFDGFNNKSYDKMLDLENLVIDRHEDIQGKSESPEHSISRSGSHSLSPLLSRSRTRSPYRRSRSRSPSSIQHGSGDHSRQQILNSGPQSMNSNLGQVGQCVQLAGHQVEGKTLGRGPERKGSNALSNQMKPNMHFVNERTMHGDACKDVCCCTKEDRFLRLQASNSQNNPPNTFAGRLDPRQDFKESTHSENESAESSISSGEPFNEQKLTIDASPGTRPRFIPISTSSSLEAGHVVINTQERRQDPKWPATMSDYAAVDPSTSREIQSIQPEACTSLNLELGLGGEDSNPHELRLIEKLSGFGPTQNMFASKSKLVNADYHKGKLRVPGREWKHYSHAGLVDPSLSLTLAAPLHRQEGFSGAALEDGTCVDNAECPLQLFK